MDIVEHVVKRILIWSQDSAPWFDLYNFSHWIQKGSVIWGNLILMIRFAVQQSWRGFPQWLHTDLKCLLACVFTPKPNPYPTEIDMASPLVMVNVSANLMGYNIIGQMGLLTCLQWNILIGLIVVGKLTHGRWHHSPASAPRLYIKERVSWTQTFMLFAFVFKLFEHFIHRFNISWSYPTRLLPF